MADVAEAARNLLVEVDAHLDYADDEGMQAAADLVRSQLAEGDASTEALENLMAEVNAHLDGNDDEDMEKASDDLRDAMSPAPAA